MSVRGGSPGLTPSGPQRVNSTTNNAVWRPTGGHHMPSLQVRAAPAAAATLLLSAAVLLLAAATAAASPADSFRTDIAPLLAKACGGCHGPQSAESGYRIDLRERAIDGGDSGIAGIVPGDAAASELFVRITSDDDDLRMPANGELLTAAEQQLLHDWIAAGAAWPDDLVSLEAMLPAGEPQPDPAAEHWAFQPVTRPEVPAANGDTSHPIDAFLAATLGEHGLAFNPEADPRALIRRVTFDLIGLPPTPEEVDAFLEACGQAGSSEQPYRDLVDQLLASPRYGERWARHWLDVVRFAESHGFEMNQMRPNAWSYRDWVIDALNSDMPYDAFVRRQIAGDAEGHDEATGFLVAGPWDQVKSPDPVLTATQRADELHDMVSTTSSAFLGLTVGCARCHDHKFDPVPQRDYYQLTAVFAGVQHGERPIQQSSEPDRTEQIAELEQQLAEVSTQLVALEPLAFVPTAEEPTAVVQRAAVVTGTTVDAFAPVTARLLRMTVLATSGAEPCIDELEVFTIDGRNVAREATPSASGSYPSSEFHKLEHINDGRYGNARSWISSEAGGGWVQLEFAEPLEISRVVWSRDRSPVPQYSDRLATAYEIAVSADGTHWQTVATHADRLPFDAAAAGKPAVAARGLPPEQAAAVASLSQQAAQLQGQLTALTTPPMAYAGSFSQPGPTHRLFRGDAMQPREEVAPGSLTRVGEAAWQLDDNAPEQERRKALAGWITSPANPLTARVIVNRLWHSHFGTGLVDTPSDLGINGGMASHPQLLDWLASELIEPTSQTADPAADRWRLKRLHRLIVTSRSFRQSSAATEKGLALDAGSRLLWRFPPQRLEAEALRDAILAVSGSLNLTMGGPGFDLFVANSNYVKVYETKTSFTDDDFRRMVYQSKPRSELDTFFGAFDCPDAAQAQPARTVSTTPLQALNMLNGAFLIDQAERFAMRLRSEAGSDPAAQVDLAFALALGRPPAAAERAAAIALAQQHGLTLLCRSLYNASEFITVR